MHSLYPHRSLYCCRILRRLRYGRGHGVHSPMAYRVVCSVVQPRYEYYLPTPERDRLALWYRLIARLDYEVTAYGETTPDRQAAMDYAALADSRMRTLPLSDLGTMGRALLYTDSAEEALRFLQVQGRAVLLTDVRRDRAAEERLRDLVARLTRGVVIDLYDHALLFSKNDNLYIYRSTV